MEKTKGFDIKKLAVGTLLAVAILAIGLVLFSINRNQSTLQTVVEANTQQISAVATRIEKKISDKMAVIEQSQLDLRTGIEAVQTSTRKLTADITGVMDEQVKLSGTVQNNSQKLTSHLALIERNRQEWENANKNARANIRQVAASALAISEEQAKLKEKIQQSDQQMSNKITVVEQIQSELQAGIEAVRFR